LFLSNLIESKGIYVLLEACRMLKEEGVAFHCDYVGGESKLISGEAFRSAIAERGLTDCVTYHGPQYGAAKDRFFREADIFVQPTFDDCFPLTLVEAMQYRLPIVSTDVGAIPDIVTDGVNGFVCPQRDVQALAEALRKLIAEPQMRVAMGQRGYELYRERMTLEVFEGNFTGLLKGIVGNG
jgi:glycosyltransferase involved in cell wall biosynthesis